MYRRLPILLIVLTVTSAHAQQGFFDQFFDSLKNSNAAKTEPVDETAASTASQYGALSLQDTAKYPRHKKRYQTSRRQHQVAPSHEHAAGTEPQPVRPERNSVQAPPAESAVPREPINDSETADQVPPPANANNELQPSAIWIAPPQSLEPWPAENDPVDTGQQPRDPASDAPREAVVNAAPEDDAAAAASEEAGADSFLDRQRPVLGGISVAWLALGMAMFVFRRPLARIIVALQRRRLPSNLDNAPFGTPSPQLSLILKNAAGDIASAKKEVSVAVAPATLPDTRDQPDTHTAAIIRIA